MLMANAIVSALVNVLALAGIPFLGYFIIQRIRHKRTFAEALRRTGVQTGDPRYIGYCAIFAAGIVAILLIWPPPLEPLLRAGSPQKPFAGLGISGTAAILALLYGVIQTGFSEELLFRGLIAGSLSRVLPGYSANLIQALIFLLPHLLVLRVMPELWLLIPLIFAAALFLGWVRIRSDSILGPWLVHASANVAICLSVAVRSTH
jgi:membrane protease YdiL (CAAX protease family)